MKKKLIIRSELHTDYSGETVHCDRPCSNRMMVTLRFTNNCSYRCDYCNFFKVGEKMAPLENFAAICDTLQKTQRDRYEFYIHGGEPSLHPQFHRIVSHIHHAFSGSALQQIQTNLYKEADFYLDLPPLVKYIVSYHPAKTRLTVFEPKLRRLYHAGRLDYVDFMLEEDNRSRIRQEFLQLKQAGYGHLIRPRIIDRTGFPQYRELLQTFKPRDRQYKITYEDGETRTAAESFVKAQSFRFMKCEARNKSVVINPDGSYWSCQAHMLSRDPRPLGNLLDDPGKFLEEVQTPMTCRWFQCMCEMELTKWRDISMKNETRYFCSNPFDYMMLNLGNDFFLCREDWLPRPLGNAAAVPVKAAWNSETAAAVRQSILDGTFQYCADCAFLEEKKGPVRPVDSISEPRLLDIIKNRTVVLEGGPRQFNLAQDKSCNLKCPSCRTEIIQSNDPIQHQINIHLQEKVLCQVKPGLKELYLGGYGDPFASALHFELLIGMQQKKYPGLKLYLRSNGQLFHRQNWHQIRRINQAVKGVQISIDAADAETYRLNRGASWDRLLKNLQFISQLRREGPLESFEIDMVVQQNNWRQMLQFIHLGKTFGADAVVFMQLYDWGTYPKKEYYNRAVHLATHPEHHRLAQFLANVSHPPDIAVYWGPFGKFIKNDDNKKINRCEEKNFRMQVMS